MADIILTGSGDFSRLKAEYDKLQRENVKLAQSLKGVSEETKKAAREEAELARAAKKVFDETRTPAERYNQQLAKLNDLVKAGKIDQDTYARAVRQARIELDATGKAGHSAMGGILSGANLARAGMTALAFSIATARRAMDDLDKKKEEAAAREKTAAPGLGQLKQLAETPEEYSNLVQEARNYQYTANIATLDQAARELFDIRSAQQEKNLPFIANLRASKLIGEAGPMMQAADALITSMGEKETGDFRAIMSKAAVMGKIAPGSIEQNVQALAKGAGTAKAIGISDKDLMAMQAFASKGAGEPEIGGTIVARLVSAFMDYSVMSEREARKKGIKPELLAKLKTGTITERLQAVEQAGGLAREEFQEIRGEEKSRRGYLTLMQNIGNLNALATEIGEAPQKDIIGKKMGFTAPELEVDLAAGRAKIRKEHSELGLALRETASTAIQNEQEAAQREGGRNETGIWLFRQLDAIRRWGQDDQNYLEEASPSASPSTQRLIKNAATFQQQSLKVLTEIRDETRKGNQRRPPTPAGTFSEPAG